MDPRARAVERLRKLLALARDQHGAPEGLVALRLAQDLATRWGLDLDAEGAGPEGPSGPFVQVPLGGDPTERYREEYRAVLLAALADVGRGGGATVTYNTVTWTGRVYGGAAHAQRVVDVYSALQPHLDREFRRFWIPRRFGRTAKAASARAWWLGVVDGLRGLLGDPPLSPETPGSSSLVLAVCDGGAGRFTTSSDTNATTDGRRVLARYRLPPDLLAALLSLG